MNFILLSCSAKNLSLNKTGIVKFGLFLTWFGSKLTIRLENNGYGKNEAKLNSGWGSINENGDCFSKYLALADLAYQNIKLIQLSSGKQREFSFSVYFRRFSFQLFTYRFHIDFNGKNKKFQAFQNNL